MEDDIVTGVVLLLSVFEQDYDKEGVLRVGRVVHR